MASKRTWWQHPTSKKECFSHTVKPTNPQGKTRPPKKLTLDVGTWGDNSILHYIINTQNRRDWRYKTSFPKHILSFDLPWPAWASKCPHWEKSQCPRHASLFVLLAREISVSSSRFFVCFAEQELTTNHHLIYCSTRFIADPNWDRQPHVDHTLIRKIASTCLTS